MAQPTDKCSTELCSKCKKVKKREDFTKLYSGGKPLCTTCKEVLDLKYSIEKTRRELRKLEARYAVMVMKPQYKTPEYTSDLVVHSRLPLGMTKNNPNQVWIIQGGDKRKLSIKQGPYGDYVSYRPNKAKYSAWKNYSVQKLYNELFQS